MNVLPVNLDDLIHARAVESVRREFKKSWDKMIRDAVIRTLCAFANDLHGLNGGYIILGIEDDGGDPILPPHGLDGLNLEQIQKEIRGSCNRIDPTYQPVLSPEIYQGRQILVIYAPCGEVRPYQASIQGDLAQRAYYVRLGSETVEAKGQLLTQLLQLTAKVTFDDRRRTDVPLSAISERLIRQFLEDIQSDLASPGISLDDVLRQLRLSARNNGGEAPRNVALLVFTERPDHHIDSARIEIAHFRDDAGGDVIETKPIVGPLQQQVRQTLDYLSNLGSQFIQKVEGQPQAERFVAFPYLAMREAIVNAVYHRGYDSPPTPIKIGLYPDRLEITSYPGPVPGLDPKHLEPGGHPPQLPARNPRVGELLKSLRLAETWHTGIPKIRRSMKENGSPAPIFDFDAERTYFRVTLPAHPGYIVLHALREAAALWHTGEKERALAHLVEARLRVPTSGALAAQLITYAATNDDLPFARRTLSDLEQMPLATERHLAYTALARAYVDRNQPDEARALLGNVPAPRGAPEAVELAILYKRSADWEHAHQLFSSVQHAIGNDPKALHEFAQTKLRLAEQMQPRSPQDKVIKRRLNLEAAELLRRVIALASDQPTRAAWAWFDLAKTLAWLQEPESEVHRACEKAIELDPSEARFQRWLSRRSTGQKKPRRH